MKNTSLLATSLAITLAIGCSSEPSNPTPSPQNSQVSTATADIPEWAGLEVVQAGIPCEQADQIVILLHGYGTKGADLEQLVQFLEGPKRAFIFPTGPHSLGSGRFAWATTEEEQVASAEQLTNLVQYTANKYPNRKIAVGGFSQGATLSSLLLTKPNLPVQSLLLYSPSLAVTEPSIVAASNVKVLLAHGREDSIIPFLQALELEHRLKAKNIPLEFIPFDGGHTITPEALEASQRLLDTK